MPFSSFFKSSVAFSICIASLSKAAYTLVDSYDASNWYTSFAFQDETDPTHGFVDYVSLADAQAAGLTKIINNQIYMGVDNNSIISTSTEGRKSLWIESKKSFLHGLLIGDFAHIPGSDCGTWPAFWTIRNGGGNYGEIDIIEGFNDISQNYMTLHSGGACSFNPPADTQTGTSNNGNTDCSLSSATGVGCSVQGPVASYGTPFNSQGGGVYALEWTSNAIRIYMFHRNAIPSDITAGNPDPSNWGLPAANFDSAYGNCNIDSQFTAQTIYFDTTFCGAEAGGQAWTDWTDCSTRTGVSTCEAYVANNPHAYDDAYWLINSVKVYQGSSSGVGGATPALPISTDGTCGIAATCQGSSFGNCCSQYGWCGSTVDHCGTDCQKAFGTCS